MRFRAAYARCGSRPRAGCRLGSRSAPPRSTAGSSSRCATAGRCWIRTRPRRSRASTGTCCCPPTASRRPARPSSTPRGNRTPATGVKGPRANRYTMGAGGLSLGEGAPRPADTRAVAAGALGVVHRDVGAREDVLVGRGVGVEIDHADARGAAHGLGADREDAVADEGDEVLGYALGGRARDARQDDRELVAADPRARVRAAHALGEPAADDPQQVVADLVAEAVVDLLEVVEVDVEQRGALRIAGAAADLAQELLLEAPAVPEAGERVVVREAVQVLLDPLALGDVLDLGDEVQGPTVLVAHDRDRQQDPDDRTLLGEVALLHLVRRAVAVDELVDVGEVGVEVVGVGDVREGQFLQLVLAVADQVAQRAVDLEEAPVEPDQGHADRRVGERGLEAPL